MRPPCLGKRYNSGGRGTSGQGLLHYNYLRPHEALGGKTPAEVTGVEYRYRNWQWVPVKRGVITPAEVSATSTVTVRELVHEHNPIVARKRFSGFHRQREKPTQMLVAMRCLLVQ